MIRVNPLLAEAARGLAGAGTAQRDYLAYLLLQAVVVFLWWPKSSLGEVLEAAEAPHTLLAAVIIVALTLSWYSLRAGAEEVLLPHQHGLREWLAATPLGPARILSGYLWAHLVQTLHLLALSLPLLLLAFTVSGGEWRALGWSLTAAVFQATFYRLAAAALYMAIGHRATMCFLLIRILLLALYPLTAWLAPWASHLVLSWRLLNAGGPVADTGAIPGEVAFVLVHAAAAAALLVLLHWQLSRQRLHGAQLRPAA